MKRLPPKSTRTNTLVPVTTLIRADEAVLGGRATRRGGRVARAAGGRMRPLAAHVEAGDAPAAYAGLRDGNATPANLPVVAPEEVGTHYRGKLRKREAPFCMEVRPEIGRAHV